MRNRAHSTSYLTDGLQAWACDPRHYGDLASDDVYIILGKAAIVNRNGKSYQSDSVSFFWGQVTMHSDAAEYKIRGNGEGAHGFAIA